VPSFTDVLCVIDAPSLNRQSLDILRKPQRPKSAVIGMPPPGIVRVPTKAVDKHDIAALFTAPIRNLDKRDIAPSGLNSKSKRQ